MSTTRKAQWGLPLVVAAVIAGACAWPTTHVAQAQIPAKHEYAFLEIHGNNASYQWSSSTKLIEHSDPDEFCKAMGITVVAGRAWREQIVNAIARDGWELCSHTVATGLGGGIQIAAFRRPAR